MAPITIRDDDGLWRFAEPWLRQSDDGLSMFRVQSMLPAIGWYAEIEDRETGSTSYAPLICWALIEFLDRADGVVTQCITGLLPSDEVNWEVDRPPWECAGFRRFTYQPGQSPTTDKDEERRLRERGR